MNGINHESQKDIVINIRKHSRKTNKLRNKDTMGRQRGTSLLRNWRFTFFCKIENGGFVKS